MKVMRLVVALIFVIMVLFAVFIAVRFTLDWLGFMPIYHGVGR